MKAAAFKLGFEIGNVAQNRSLLRDHEGTGPWIRIHKFIDSDKGRFSIQTLEMLLQHNLQLMKFSMSEVY